MSTPSQPNQAANILDDFDPRGVDSGANGDFGDFSSAFSQAAPAAPTSMTYELIVLLFLFKNHFKF